VAKNKPKRVKHIPQRTCVGCKQVMDKQTMTRIVRTDTGIQIDTSGKLPGRGAYLHNLKSCWQAALKGKLSHALKAEIDLKARKMLEEYAESLPESPSGEQVM
jgi:predicted RNA-binding protein YlxR (DUF448 family)